MANAQDRFVLCRVAFFLYSDRGRFGYRGYAHTELSKTKTKESRKER